VKISSVVAGGLTCAVVAATPLVAASSVSAEPVARQASASGLAVRDLAASGARPASDRLLVKLAGRQSARSLALPTLDSLADGRTRPLGGGWFALPAADNLETARRALDTTPGVLRVQADPVRRAFGDRYYRRYQPYLRASMDVNGAWKRASGRGITVAVVDTGVDPNHEDLPRVLRGRDFVSGDANASDGNGHGTFVAGVVGAERDNRKGIAGVSRATILPVRVLNSRGFGRDSDIARGIRWAAAEGADIINLSLGGGRGSRILKDAVRYADRRGALVVAASGNSGGTKPMYPAAYPQALAVGATDKSDRMTSWSQHGPWVDVVAPGVRIASTVPRDGYALGDGTSFASPLVAGAAALALSDHRGWSDDQLRAALLRGAADAGPVGPDPFTGLGVLDVDGLVGGPAKAAVSNTGPIAGTSPATARPMSGDADVPASSPEGTDRWFRVSVSSATDVMVSATTRSGRAGALRGDIQLSLYDANFARLDLSDRRSGSGSEQVRAVADDDVYVRVRNLEDTRWPTPVRLDLTTTAADPGDVQVGQGRVALVSALPVPESYGADTSAPIEVQLGPDVLPSSVGRRSVRLVDGETGQVLDSEVDLTGNVLSVDPADALASGRTFSVYVDGLRTTGGRAVESFRVGFRTAR
jgi:subtilisin family serine protease